MVRMLLYFLVFLFMLLGIVGLILPLVPAFPFFLISAILAIKISRRNVVRMKRIPLFGRFMYDALKRFRKRRKRPYFNS